MDPLKTLELDLGCTREDVEKSFRRLSLIYHPDKNPNNKKAEECFKKISNARDLIHDNPTIINKKVTESSDTIYAEINVELEDLYFEVKKTIALKRVIPCSTCRGFGTEDIEQGLCHLCKGTGHIDNKILTMMKRSASCLCPSCNGIGIKKEFSCKKCKGKKIQEEIKEYKFNLSLKNYNNKCIVLNGKGNHYPHSLEGDVIIKLKIKENPLYKIENGNLSLEYYTTPVQNLIGDICEVDVFNKIFKFKVPTEDGKIIIEDKRKTFIYTHKILIRTIVSKPIITPEIKKLYEKILILEKKATSSS
jgi:DnaJ-class molecular chaperone